MSLMSEYYSRHIDQVEKKLNLYSNTSKAVDPISSGTLVYDWLCGGGVSLFTSIAGEEQSGKTTTSFHIGASALREELPFVSFFDAEGTLNTEYAGNIWRPFGVDILRYMDDPRLGYRYYRNNVIEKFFDFFVNVIDGMPDKIWVPQANTWAYVFPKRDDHFKKLMEHLELKPSKSLSNQHQFLCPTDNSKAEGVVIVDSFAAMLTNDTEEKQEVSGRRAQEASAFSLHLKRVMGKIAQKQIVLFGTNQLRQVPGVVYGGPDAQFTEPGGNALKFYSAIRFRTFSRAVPEGWQRDPKDSSSFMEKSVEGDGVDRYSYKLYKNTKNKLSRPKLSSFYRVWTSDTDGKPRGIDPAWDVYQHLLNTKQIVQKGKELTFHLKPSVGKNTAELLNGKSLTFRDLKLLIVGEVTSRRGLLKKANTALGVENVAIRLREKLFKQLRTDKSLWATAEE